MRAVTRRVVYAVLAVVVVLLALGALPSFLRAGDPYYVTAVAAGAPAGVEPIDAANISERRYPYTTAALAAANASAGGTPGRSDAYYRGPVGLKGAFTHSPFDEFAAYREQYPGATEAGAVYVRRNATTYRLTVDQEAET
ncbi:MAG: hypothetical protein ABEI11_01875 [Haloarculaceae archaeon]